MNSSVGETPPGLAQQKTLLGLADPIQMERGAQAGREGRTAEERAPLLFREDSPPELTASWQEGFERKYTGLASLAELACLEPFQASSRHPKMSTGGFLEAKED